MSKKLLIVESPAKAKKIGEYLGGAFVVMSSVGHVRDLPKKGLSIKIAEESSRPGRWKFTPTYEITSDKKKIVAELRAAAKSADEVFLAPDPDREGEAIAWHLNAVLANELKNKPVHRVTYNEITKNAVLRAIEEPRDIDLARVDAQQARRILDRLVGFKVSPLLWKSLNYGYSLSAGRVQSVALRILVEREREIESFKTEEYWILGVEASKGTKETAFTARLAKIDGEKPDIREREQANTYIDDLDASSLRVVSVKRMEKSRHAHPPFTTSSLQQAASSVYGFSPKRTMDIAQKLYEAGLITYMRTDSFNISIEAQNAAKNLIIADFGESYWAKNFYKSKDSAQQAHEAIRPTDVSVRPGSLQQLSAQELKLYDLIWRRFVCSQMAPARFMQTTVGLETEKEGQRHSYFFTATTSDVIFEGFLAADMTSRKNKLVKTSDRDGEEQDEVASLPPLAEGETLKAERWLSDRKETKPPSRYSEASLVKALEENGVGRPSTYAQTIEVLVNRKYANREAKQLVPTKRGMDVNDWLVKKMPALFDVGYTAQMEAKLDIIEEGDPSKNGDEMLSDFYNSFTKWLGDAKEPPPPRERFDALLALLDLVTTWKPPVTVGKRTFSDELFAKSLRDQLNEGKMPPTDRQLQALAKLVAVYRDQIPDAEIKLIDLGWEQELDREKNAPPAELTRWTFQVVDGLEGLTKNAFVSSLREQVEHGRPLTLKQFQTLARTVLEKAVSNPSFEHIKSRLENYIPGGFTVEPVDPSVPEIFSLLGGVTEWKPPTKRGRRTYNDKEFVASIRDQFDKRGSLTERQVDALRRICYTYRAQIPTFEEVADRLKLKGTKKSAEDDGK